MTRRRRIERPGAGRHQVTRRDQEIAYAVGRMAQATTDQLRRLYFSERSTASRRLAKLVGLRVLDVHVCGQTDPNVYTLAPAGVALLRERGVDPCLLHKSRVGRHLDLHLAALNDLRVELVLASRGRDDVTIEAFHSDLDLRRAAGGAPPAYVPDAIVELVVAVTPFALVVEVDAGTENPSVFAGKVATTVGLWRAGGSCWGAAPGTWRPAVFVATSARARSLARVIVTEGGGTFWLVAEFDRVRADGMLGPVFATADEVARTPRNAVLPYEGSIVASDQEVPR